MLSLEGASLKLLAYRRFPTDPPTAGNRAQICNLIVHLERSAALGIFLRTKHELTLYATRRDQPPCLSHGAHVGEIAASIKTAPG